MTARGTVSQKHQAAINRAKAKLDRALDEHRAAIRAASSDPEQPASIRELAAFTGLSPNTIRKIVSSG